MNNPYVIAEIGSNFRNYDDVIDSVMSAKKAGADACKFQLYNHEELYGVPGDMAGVLPFEWIPKLAHHAQAVGIDFLCTAFSPKGYELVDPYVKYHKVASAELSHIRILETLKRLGKPVFLSTGASGYADIAKALEILDNTPTTLLYCVSNYPAREVDLEAISVLRSNFGRNVGFSDHSLDICNLPRFAVEYFGASVVEKHFTLSHDILSPDVAHSLNPTEFSHMVRAIRRGYDLSLTRPKPDIVLERGRIHSYAGEERDMIMKHNRRLIATRPIAAGDTLKEGVNFGIYRSKNDDQHAFSPFILLDANHSPAGQIAKRAIAVGRGIGPGDY